MRLGVEHVWGLERREPLLRRLRSSLLREFTIWSGEAMLMSDRSGYSAAKMAEDLTVGFALNAMIPIPPIPTSFFPGAKPASALLGKGGSIALASRAPAKVLPARQTSVFKA